ncbi:hypothetical protein NIVACYA_04425 (plasmid) [Planktothrix agardhii]|nr:hypothetical protein NIVACYA_04425 [Planktothrix agardhii]CAH2575743.1 hypothetical protein PRNO82_04991 [Planktothrix rubescens]
MKYSIFWSQSLGVNSTSLDPNTVRLFNNYLSIAHNLQNAQQINVDYSPAPATQGGAA